MKTTSIKELQTDVSSRRAEAPTSGRASVEVGSNKLTNFSEWPFFWWTRATTEAAVDLDAVSTTRSGARSWPRIPWRLRSLRRRCPARKPRSIRRPASTGCLLPPWAGTRPAFRRQPRARLCRLGVSFRGVARQVAASAGEGRAQGGSSRDLCGRRPAATQPGRACIEPLPQDHRFRSEAWQQLAVQL